MPLTRIQANPLLEPKDVQPTRDDLEIYCTLNPGAVRFDGEILLLVRVGEKAVDQTGWVGHVQFDARMGQTKVRRVRETDGDLRQLDKRVHLYRGWAVTTSMSHLRIARSTDGRSFTFDPAPLIYPSTPYEAFGCEDARITGIDGRYYITYTAVSDRGVAVAMASTTDFVRCEKHGVIFPPYQKDVCIFPEQVGGRYVCRHRPYMSKYNPASIWTAYSPDLHCWGRHELTVVPAAGTWESDRIGCGAPPIRTDDGWLEIYHARDADGQYHLGAMLSDLDRPHRLLTRSTRPVFSPQADYEMTGIYANCVFSNGLIADEDGTLTVYYGAADRICAAAVTTVDEMVAAAKR